MKKIIVLSLLIIDSIVPYIHLSANQSQIDNAGSAGSNSNSNLAGSSDAGSAGSSGWSDGPPGGSGNTGTSVATLIKTSPTPPSSALTPLVTGTTPTNHPFAELYNALTHLQGALLQSINVYWNATNPPATSAGCNFSNLPTSLDGIMQGEIGNYFGAVFMPGSLPLQIVKLIEQTIISYVQGMTQKLTIETYGAAQGNDFIGFTETQLNSNPGTFTGNLATVDQVWKNTVTIITTTFQKLKSGNKVNNQTIKFIENTLDTILNTYTEKRYQLIINWYTKLVKDLYNKFNPKLFNQGFFSYTTVPNSAALAGYSNAYLDACSQLTNYYTSLTTQSSYTVDNAMLVVNKPVATSDTVFTNPTSFFTTLQNATLNRVGDICAYTTLLGLQRSNDRVANKNIADPAPFPSLTYTTVQDVPTFLTSTQHGALPNLPYFPGTQLPTSSDFYCTQQLISYLSSYIEGALDAFNFNEALSTQAAFIYDSLSPAVISSYQNEGLQASSNLLNALKLNVNAHDDALQNLQKRISNSTTKKVAISSDAQNIITTDFKNVTNVFQELIITANAALNAQYWYTQSGNAGAAADYSSKATLLQNALTNFKSACILLSQASDKTGSKAYQLYSQAGDLLYNSASTFSTLNLVALNTYSLTLASYVKITAYQTLMNYYASYYQSSLSTYNHYLKTPPHYSYSNGRYTFDVVSGYEKSLFIIIYYIDQALSTSIQGYQNQLSFYLSQKKDNASYLSLIWPLQDSLLLLSNYQEAITPLLLQTPCATTSDNKALLCGIDYNLIEATSLTATDQDIASLIIKAHDQYTAIYPLFKNIDAIMNKYPKSSNQYKALQQFTSLDAIFQLSANQLNFSEFFLLHQARLYTSVAQRLLEGKPFFWNEGDQIKSQGSAYALLLYAYAAAIYQHLGYTQHAQTVNAMKHLLFSPALIASFKNVIETTLQQSLTSNNATIVNQMFQELNALCTVLYLSPGDTTYFTFLQMLSKSITKNVPFGSIPFSTLESAGYADWLATQTDANISYPHLQAALAYYQGYVIAIAKQDVHASSFLQAAQTQFNLFIKEIETVLQENVAPLQQKDSSPTPSDVAAKLAIIKQLITTKDAYDHALYQMEFLQTVFAPDKKKNCALLTTSSSISSVCSQFLQGSLNIPGMIGDIYFLRATQNLQTIQNLGTLAILKDLSSDFATIIDYYTQAKNYYGSASISDTSYQDKFLLAEQGLTNTYAYQNYLLIIPNYNLTFTGLSLPQKSTQQLSGFTLPSVTVDQAATTYNSSTPLYLYKQRTITVPSILTQSLTQDSQASLSVLKTIAAPLYSVTLTSNVKDQTPSATIAQYVSNYTNMYTKICSSGTTIGDQKIKGKLSYQSKGAQLTLLYEPLSPLPRFNSEIYSALTYYADTCAKLYASSITPVNYHNQLLIPSNNLAGQDLIDKAILNTYLSRAVELRSAIETFKQSNIYVFLKNLSLTDRIRIDFYNYFSYYKSIQPLYEELIGLYIATNSFLSNYGINSSLCSDIIASTIIEWMQTNSIFLCGTPDITTLIVVLHMLMQSTTEIKRYANQTQNAQKYISQAGLLFAAGYEYFAQTFEITPDTPLTTTNIDTAAVYPDVNKASLPSYMKWKDAGTYYTYAASFLEKFLNQNPNFSADTQKKITSQMKDYYQKAISNFITYSTYNAALFCSNAFQECRCIQSEDALNTIELKTANNPAYPPWDYPLTGLRPNIQPAQYYTYPICEADPQKGSTYIVTMPDTVYQGVASMEIPQFATIRNQCSQGQSSSYTSMYTTMQQTLLNALYYYQQTLSLMKKLAPPVKAPPTSTFDPRTQEITSKVTKWIVNMLNTNPAFYDPIAKSGTGLPTIVIPTSSANTENINGKQSRVTQFANSIACTELDLSLANSKQIYLHTLRYWASQPSFYPTLLQGLLQWCTPGDYDIAQRLLADTIQMLESFFIRSYFPSIDGSDAQYQMQQMIATSQQDSTGTSAGYF